MVKSSRKIGICLTIENLSFPLNIEDKARRPMPPYFCTQTQVAQGLFEKEKISKTIEWNE